MGQTVVAFIRYDNGGYSWQTTKGGVGAFKTLKECVEHFFNLSDFFDETEL